MDLFMEILALTLKCVTVYTALISLFFLLPKRRLPKAPPKARFAVLVAARNEEAVIGSLIRSVKAQRYPKRLFDIYVIPNNCTDDTSGAAYRAGARILACPDPVHCKGDALHQAFQQLLGRYDAYCVFDADNLLDPDFLARMNDAIQNGARVAKGNHIAMNPYASWVSGCYDLYFENFNLLYNRARSAIGLSAKLAGTGFMVTDSLMQQLGGWNTVTMTEDTEFAALCAAAGVRIHYVPEAVCYDEQPTTFRASLRQRRRWSAGVQTVANRYVPRLLGGKPSWLRLDFTVFLCLTYVQLLAMLPVCYRLAAMPLPEVLGLLGVSLGSFWVGMTGTALFLCLTARRNVWKMKKAILLYPLFVASWYPLHLFSLFVKPRVWAPIIHSGSRQQAA